MKISEIEINVDSSLWAIIGMIKYSLTQMQYPDIDKTIDRFTKHYKNILQEHEEEDQTDLARYYRLISVFKPALASILKPGTEHDQLCDIAISQFNVVLDRIRREVNDDNPRKKKIRGPTLPGSGKSINLKYFCSVCKQEFEIPAEMQVKLLNSDNKMELPKHCDTEMQIRIAPPKKEGPIKKEDKSVKKIEIYPAELLMGHTDSKESNVEYLKLVSVGIDIGSSTSHLIFSRLTLRKEISFFNMTNRFILVDREIIYEGNIIFTPLLDRNTIDIEAIIKFCEEEYQKAGFTPETVDTGAVIVTGETAKKQNAAEIVNRISSESGKFVSASAGPNFESLLGALGSGIVRQSSQLQKTILNSDIGGGTSNMAISSKGDVISCSCINVGGRLLGIDENFKIWRIDGPSEFLMKELNMQYNIGDTILERDARILAHEYAKAQLEVMQGPATSKIAQGLMMTDDLDFSTPIDFYSFSGGIGEMIHETNQNPTTYNDIGHYLAEEIKLLMDKEGLLLIEPENKIRATVIGAGAFSLSVSGSTCYVDEDIKLPLNNVPVIPVNLTQDNFSPTNVMEEINKAFSKYDMKEGDDLAALYFKSPIYPKEELLTIFAKSLEKALPNSIVNQKQIILLFQSDLAKLLGLTIHKQTAITSNLICLDELTLEAGDWIDIGPSLHKPPKEAFPVTIKSLVFNH
ncbi:ethanolamine ammonia-lyase reactivating factor EutA [Promethearchaeum syntrophicum]|uniref:Ethanolamine ammonia-lyase reactivating factor EutA n=1 Tax=Promethearchaeum syntrophicum TaxID=2594042 RepID=A0A5B9D6E6_9ARCH|nr:ethanolamine ammonia-lyase reactivating factor EutA [Candidatus Prometheoarchaeum syntrophicum]QEE14410.1 reactivating factor for ethanolamine ammonia lyase [Candidatus Prometheoarchaeum syntrophicum]